MAGIPYRAIYKNTTIDPPGTIKHAREVGAEVINPKESFFQLIQRKGFPTRRTRFCCEKLKEYKILGNAVQGIRRNESVSRSKRYSEEDPIICRIYGSKKNHVNVYLPILNWTDEDVAEFVAERGIKCHPLYYDEQGNFHVERRLGCMCCPLRYDQGLAEFKERPRFVRQWIKNASIWFNDPNRKLSSREKFGTIYDLFYHNVFCKSYQQYIDRKHGLFGDMDFKQWLEDYFKIKLD